MSTALKEFDQLQADMTMLIAPTLMMRVLDSSGHNSAAEALKQVKALGNRIEAVRVKEVAPHNERVKEINGYAKSIREPLEKAEAHLKEQMRGHVIREEARRAELQKKLEDERRAAEAAAREVERKAQEETLIKAEVERKRLADENRLLQAQMEKERLEHEAALAAFGCSVNEEEEAREKAEAQRVAEANRLMAEAKLQLEQQVTAARVERERNAREKEFQKKQKELEASKPKGVRREWKHNIEDYALVPLEYRSVDHALIAVAVKAGVRSIPGVLIFEETYVFSRADSGAVTPV